jgi:hypothetical protein
VTELVLLVTNDAPVHAYVDAPVADNVVVPPDTTDAGDAVAVTVGKGLTPIKKEPDVAVALPSITTILKYRLAVSAGVWYVKPIGPLMSVNDVPSRLNCHLYVCDPDAPDGAVAVKRPPVDPEQIV